MAPPAEAVDDVDVEMAEDDDQTQRLINEEYKTWKKNSPFLYDKILSTALDWPTLTTQWFPDVKDDPTKNTRKHRLLIGTHTSDTAPNYLQIAEVQIPKSVEPNPNDYDEERGEIGGYGATKNQTAAMSFTVIQKIDHDGEVNKARYQPQNPDIIATLCVNSKIAIFDRTKHSLEPNGTVNPQIELIGHKKEGFGLAWNPHDAGGLASGSEDNTVCLWDIKTVQDRVVKPSRRYTHHTNIVNEVQYHPMSKNLIGTVSDDLTFQLLDVRQPSTEKATIVAKDGHVDAINSLAFNPAFDCIVVTASADKTIGVWDMRNVKEKVHTLESHEDAVTSVQWHPHEPTILGSASYDRRILFWDLSKVGEEQLPGEAEDGPPELLFMHGGHTNHLADFTWNPNDPWLVCSAAEDNLLQVWRVADSIVGREDPELPVDEIEA